MPSNEEIINEFKKYDPKRNVSQQDIDNVKKHGLGLVKSTFGKPGAGGGEGTAKSIGQTADTTPMTFQEDASKSARENLEEMTSKQPLVQSVFEDAMRMKAEKAAPFNEAISKRERKLRNVSTEDFKDLSPDARLRAASRKANRIKSSISYLQQQKADQEAELQDALQSMTDMYNAELSALGLRVESEEVIVDRAFSAPILLGGVMPEGLPAEYQAAWQAASAAARAEAARGGGGGGGGGRGGSSSAYGSIAGGAYGRASKAGYDRVPKEGGGYDYFYQGQPITFEQYAAETGMSYKDTLYESASEQDQPYLTSGAEDSTGTGTTKIPAYMTEEEG